jgi:hypothetical protein
VLEEYCRIRNGEKDEVTRVDSPRELWIKTASACRTPSELLSPAAVKAAEEAGKPIPTGKKLYRDFVDEAFCASPTRTTFAQRLWPSPPPTPESKTLEEVMASWPDETLVQRVDERMKRVYPTVIRRSALRKTHFSRLKATASTADLPNILAAEQRAINKGLTVEEEYGPDCAYPPKGSFALNPSLAYL